MNKKLRILSAAALLALAPAVNAASTPAAPFNVTVVLTSVCSITAGPANVTFTYTSFQAGASTGAGGGFSVRCTNNLPFTMALDATTGTVAGLTYNLTLPAGPFTGTGAAVAYTVGGTIAGGQGGDATASTTSARTLTISY